MAPGSGMSVYGMVKCAADKPPKPIPGGIYCKCPYLGLLCVWLAGS